jgi:NodT family efflux transporter outer membrane factor (OMF) lipoprotein
VAALGGCTGLPGSAGDPSKAAAPLTAPSQWLAPLPHNGQLTDLTRWWQQFNDPLLTQLIDAAQAVSPSLASAQSRIALARAASVSAGAALGPTVNAAASASRGRQDLSVPLGSTSSAGIQAAWELDLFGGNRAGRDAAQNRLVGAEASWHDARVSVAAEVAGAYLGLRACEAQLAQTQLDANSRLETARLTELTAKAGFQTPANAALARASAAQGNSLLTQQRAQCDRGVKSLVALTGMAEPALRSQLGAASAQLPKPVQIVISSVPAEALAQRPDLFSAAREVLAASADLSQSQAQRYPRIVLNGSIAAARFSSAAGTLDDTFWSVGPVSVSLPLFDGGARRANVEAARARYREASVNYAARLRTAVREVEEALITLQSTAARAGDAQVGAEGFATSYRATDALFKNGLANLFELEDARRNAVQAHSALIELQRERVAAWLSLYRALGGGWVADAQTATLIPIPN